MTTRAPHPVPGPDARYAAIDFETADHGRDSACAVGVVVVENGRIVHEHASLLRPPRRRFVFTYIHGIAWKDVENAPTFAEHWPTLASLLDGLDHLVAHNAPFDRGVLAACCEAAGITPPALRFECTVRLARSTWGVRPTRLPDVCGHLGITL